MAIAHYYPRPPQPHRPISTRRARRIRAALTIVATYPPGRDRDIVAAGRNMTTWLAYGEITRRRGEADDE